MGKNTVPACLKQEILHKICKKILLSHCLHEQINGNNNTNKRLNGRIGIMAVSAQPHSQLADNGLASPRKAAYAAANVAESKKALSTIVMDVRKVTVLADFFVICGASSPTQVKAIVDNIEHTLARLGYRAHTVEGKMEGRWVLLDFGHIIVHVLQERERSLYNLERFWNHALIVDRSSWLDPQSSKE